MGNLSSKMGMKSFHASDLSTYEDACQADPDVKSFDAALKVRTENMLKALAGGVNEQSQLSLDSLGQVTSGLLEVDLQVVEVVLAYKQDVWKDADLFELVGEFFDNSLATLDLCSEMGRCIKGARGNQMMVEVALSLMPEAGEPSRVECERVMGELNHFLEAGNPFGAAFVEKFMGVREQHLQMLQKLQQKKKKLDKKLKTLALWAKISSIILGAVVATLIICSILAVALSAPAPVSGSLAIAATLPHQTMGRWIKSLWSRYEQQIIARQEVVVGLARGTCIAITEMETLRMLAGNLVACVDALSFDAGFAAKEERENPMALVVAMEDIAKVRESFVRGLDELEVHNNECSRRIHQARLVVLQRIMKPA